MLICRKIYNADVWVQTHDKYQHLWCPLSI